MVSDGKVFPICCDGQFKADLMNKLVEEAQEGNKGCNFVFVDSLDEKYTEPSKTPVENDSSSNSAFKGKNAEECYELLKKLRENGSDINPSTFAILDNRSTKDGSLIIVDAADNDVEAVRAVFSAAEMVLFSLFVGNTDMEELKQRASEYDDGVYRVKGRNSSN